MMLMRQDFSRNRCCVCEANGGGGSTQNGLSRKGVSVAFVDDLLGVAFASAYHFACFGWGSCCVGCASCSGGGCRSSSLGGGDDVQRVGSDALGLQFGFNLRL